MLSSVLCQICPSLSILKGYWELSNKFGWFSRGEGATSLSVLFYPADAAIHKWYFEGWMIVKVNILNSVNGL